MWSKEIKKKWGRKEKQNGEKKNTSLTIHPTKSVKHLVIICWKVKYQNYITSIGIRAWYRFCSSEIKWPLRGDSKSFLTRELKRMKVCLKFKPRAIKQTSSCRGDMAEGSFGRPQKFIWWDKRRPAVWKWVSSFKQTCIIAPINRVIFLGMSLKGGNTWKPRIKRLTSAEHAGVKIWPDFPRHSSE